MANLETSKTLHLHLKFKYFDAIASGEKVLEYRDAEKWKHKLDRNAYTDIRLYRGYEKVSDSTVIDMPYKGYILVTIEHEHFDNEKKLVCAINVKHDFKPAQRANKTKRYYK